MQVSIKSVEDDSVTLLFKGKGVNYSTINTIRRVILSEIPTYGLPKENIKIETNTSIFNNDYIQLRIGLLSIPKLSNKVTYLHPEGTNDQDKIDIYLHKVNTTQSIINVTTNDLVCYQNGEEVSNFYKSVEKTPYLIVKLKPGQELRYYATATLGKASMNNIWSAVGFCKYKKIKDDEYLLTFNTLKQLSYSEILEKAFAIIVKKLDEIKITVGDNYKTSGLDKMKKIIITLENENHTMGNLITYALQKHPSIDFAGYKQDHLLIDTITLRIEANNFNPIKSFFEVIDYLKKLYTNVLTSSIHVK